MNEAKLINQFIDALHHDPNATPPPGLDPDLADFVRELVQVRQPTTPSPAVEERVWQRALASSRNRSASNLHHRPKPSTNGHKRITTEENPMTTLTMPRQQTPAHSLRFVALMAAVVILFGSVLFFTVIQNTSNGPAAVYLSPQAANEAIFERYINEAWNAGNTDALSDILTTDHVCHEPGMPDMIGIDSMVAMIDNYRAAFPDWQFAIESITATDDEVWARLTGTGIQDGPFTLSDGTVIEATGSAVAIEVTLNARFTDGKITEQWMQSDVLGMLQQLEVAAPAEELVTEAQNLEIARRVMDELWNGTNLDSAKELYSRTNSSFFPAHTDREVMRLWPDWREMYEALHQAFPDLQLTVERMYAEGDMVVVHYTAQGTLENSYATSTGLSMPATGEMIYWDGVFLYRMEDGQITEEWWYWDNETTGAIDYCR
jgi:steroid delta-isomerase-like uncharacterized protein